MNGTSMATLSKLYHVSHVGDRASILKYGLDHNYGQSDWREDFYGVEGEAFPEGNYLYIQYEDALSYANDEYEYDIWEVNTDSIDLVKDPYDNGAYYSTKAITSTNLKIVREAKGAEEYGNL